MKQVVERRDGIIGLLADGRVCRWNLGYPRVRRTNELTFWRLPKIIQIAAGPSHSLALSKSGVVYSWGSNWLGELGKVSDYQRVTPRKVKGLPEIKQICAGEKFSLALDKDGRVWGFGDVECQAEMNDTHGTNTPLNILTKPEVISSLPKVSQIAVGFSHALVLLENGEVMGWGQNGFGQLGRYPNRQNQPRQNFKYFRCCANLLRRYAQLGINQKRRSIYVR